jgi:hypothetical protein
MHHHSISVLTTCHKTLSQIPFSVINHTIGCNSFSHVFVKIARVTDTGRASVTNQTKPLLVEILVQATARFREQGN